MDKSEITRKRDRSKQPKRLPTGLKDYPVRVMLTGGSGFIGRNLRESYLSENYELVCPSHLELELSNEDAVKDFIVKGDFDVIIHAAAKPGHRAAQDRDRILLTNLRMFFNIARNSDYFGRLITIGSGAIYDMRNYRAMMSEDYFDKHVPVDELGLSKYIIQKHIENMGNRFVDLRVFGIYGRYEEYAIRFISNMICKAIFGLPLSMRKNRRFSYLFIDDLAPVIEFFVNNEARHEAYNVTPDEVSELYSIAETVRTLSKTEVEIIVAEDGYGPDYTGDNARLRAEHKEIHFTPINEGVKVLYEWYSANKDLIDESKLFFDEARTS